MSGTVCGILDAYQAYPGNPGDNNQSLFTRMFLFWERMVAVGNAERVALQYGNGGTGTEFYDEANPFGENAFFVYKMLASASTERTIDLYILMQWADSASFGNSPGNPGKIKGGTTQDGIGWTMAFREDGTSPWGGTTNDDGTDTKGATVWTPGSSTVHVLSRSCSPATPTGSFVTNKEDTTYMFDASTLSNRLIAVGDADSVIFATQDTSIDWNINYGGIYEPRDGLTPDYPFILFGSSNSDSAYTINDGVIFGDNSGTTSYEGGVIGNFSTDYVNGCYIRGLLDVLNSDSQPNLQISPAEVDEFPWYISISEQHPGICGKLPPDIIASVGGISNNTMSVDGTKGYVGYDSITSIKLSIPWDGVAPPGAGVARTGRTM